MNDFETPHVQKFHLGQAPESSEHKTADRMVSLGSALSKAQAKIKPPLKNRHVDFTPKNGGQRVKYSYADLADVIESVRVPLSENGLCIVHQLEKNESEFGLRTTLLHASGESLSTWYPLPHPSNIRAQEFGSALTYARRYSLSSLVGIASEEDDDGASAPSPEKPKDKPVVNTKIDQSNPMVNDSLVKKMFQESKANGWTDQQVKSLIELKFGISQTKELTLNEWRMIMNIFENKHSFEKAMEQEI